MSDYPPRRFDFGQPAVVQQPFTMDGRDFKPGERFPYEELGIDKLRMRGFWLGSYVDFKPASPKPDKRAARGR